MRFLPLLLALSCALTALAGAGVPEHSVFRDGREFAPDRQVMVFLRSEEVASESGSRMEEYRELKRQLAEMYPWRRIVSIETQSQHTFWRGFDESMSYLGDVAITHVVLLTSGQIVSHDAQNHVSFRHQIGDRQASVYFPSVMDGKSRSGAPLFEPSYFGEIRSRIADQAFVGVMHAGALDPLMRPYHEHAFYSRMFGLRKGHVAITHQRLSDKALFSGNLVLNLLGLSSVFGAGYASTLSPLELSFLGASLVSLATFGVVEEILKDDTLERWVPGRLSLSIFENNFVFPVDSRATTRNFRRKMEHFVQVTCPAALTGETLAI